MVRDGETSVVSLSLSTTSSCPSLTAPTCWVLPFLASSDNFFGHVSYTLSLQYRVLCAERESLRCLRVCGVSGLSFGLRGHIFECSRLTIIPVREIPNCSVLRKVSFHASSRLSPSPTDPSVRRLPSSYVIQWRDF